MKESFLVTFLYYSGLTFLLGLIFLLVIGLYVLIFLAYMDNPLALAIALLLYTSTMFGLIAASAQYLSGK